MVADGLTYALNFAVGERGVYFVAGAEPPFSIDFVDHASGRRSTLVRLSKRWWYGVALHPDERSLLYATVESSGANLMLVEGVE